MSWWRSDSAAIEEVVAASRPPGSMVVTVVLFQGVPNQQESASRSAGAAVPVGSPVAAAQAM